MSTPLSYSSKISLKSDLSRSNKQSLKSVSLKTAGPLRNDLNKRSPYVTILKCRVDHKSPKSYPFFDKIDNFRGVRKVETNVMLIIKCNRTCACWISRSQTTLEAFSQCRIMFSIQFLKCLTETYLPKSPFIPHGVGPHDVTPTTIQLFSTKQVSGDPESPLIIMKKDFQTITYMTCVYTTLSISSTYCSFVVWTLVV